MFHVLLDALPVGAWQTWAADAALPVLLARPSPALDTTSLREKFERLLESQGTRPVRLEILAVDEIERTTAGKMPAVRTDPSAGASGVPGSPQP